MYKTHATLHCVDKRSPFGCSKKGLERKKDIVRWHWLPLSVTWYLLLVVLKNWWDLVALQDGWEWFNIYFLMAYGHLLVLVFLLVSAVLPDKIPENGINLKTYYF